MNNLDKTQKMNSINPSTTEEPIDISKFLHNDPISKASEWLYNNILGPFFGFFDNISKNITNSWINYELDRIEKKDAARKAARQQEHGE